jgi:hypothetical protein
MPGAVDTVKGLTDAIDSAHDGGRRHQESRAAACSRKKRPAQSHQLDLTPTPSQAPVHAFRSRARAPACRADGAGEETNSTARPTKQANPARLCIRLALLTGRQ